MQTRGLQIFFENWANNFFSQQGSNFVPPISIALAGGAITASVPLPFVWKNDAGTVVLEIPADIRLGIEVLRCDDTVLHIICHEKSSLALVEKIAHTKPTALAYTRMSLAEAASLQCFCLHDSGVTTSIQRVLEIFCEADARAHATLAHLGAAKIMCDITTHLAGKNAKAKIEILNALAGAAHCTMHTKQSHPVAGASSDLLCLNVLDDTARADFFGSIHIAEGAHRSDAYQKVRNLLLSDEAATQARPELEILANDVRCSHGATTAGLNPNEVFYLLARGISRTTASQMLVEAFFNSVAKTS